MSVVVYSDLHYWVRIEGVPGETVARFDGNEWWLAGDDRGIPDNKVTAVAEVPFPLAKQPDSLRDWFAGQALSGMLRFTPRELKTWRDLDEWGQSFCVAHIAYKIADQMLSRREFGASNRSHSGDLPESSP